MKVTAWIIPATSNDTGLNPLISRVVFKESTTKSPDLWVREIASRIERQSPGVRVEFGPVSV